MFGPSSFKSSVLLCAVSFGLTLAPAVVLGEPFRVSLSVSGFAEPMFKDGIVFTDGRRSARNLEQLQQMFIAHGGTELSALISTMTPSTGPDADGSLVTGLKRATLARTLGVPFVPQLGLWKTYGDSGLQPSPDFSDYPQLKLPGPWTTLTIDQMLPLLRGYGALVARQILAAGARVPIWGLGNEVEYGVAGVAIPPRPHEGDSDNGPGWYRPPNAVDPVIGTMTHARLAQMDPAERIAWLQAHVWPYVGRMLGAVAEGIRSVEPGARFTTHIADSTDTALTVAFYEALRGTGFLPDELGVSYYPTWGQDTLPKFQATVRALHQALGRPVFISEFAFPAGLITGYYAKWNIPQPGYPLDDQGQAAFLRTLTRWGSQTGMVSGIRPTAPELCESGWAAMSFFRLQGKTAVARPGLDAMEEGLRPERVGGAGVGGVGGPAVR